MVAPFAGAWIEIPIIKPTIKSVPVAPFAGAWIEIYVNMQDLDPWTSLPSRERGLKSNQIIGLEKAKVSLPSRERGLKYKQDKAF